MKKSTSLIALLLALVLMLSLAACGKSGNDAQATDPTAASEEPAASEDTAAEEEADDFGIFPEIAGENGTTYAHLFTVILGDEYEDYWVSKCAELVGEDNAQATADMLRGFISRDIYGQEAVDTYTAEDFGFDCWFINDAETFTFDGNEVTVALTDGSEQTHTYEYLGVYKVGEGEPMIYQGQEIDPSFECDVYKSTDDAGEFTYLLLRDDTMASTYHIEFRYGSDLDKLQEYMTGDYAYWLAAGIDKDADVDTIHDVIDLFITENVAAE